ncbi:histidine kinase [Hasllibacter halocynthiae]|uniref:histidine kinase n=1 Tax=Hasllibacter halocynthiae TaxID=595589 RepID=A0A2T0X873_9RHOB|nr:ATP-binding protein [Hasllibacter halocynthiae]PRY95133.1 histidine kinase [Hasllibacter halocynthiae]
MTGRLIDALPLPVVTVDRSGRLSGANPAGEALIGGGLTGRHFVTALRRPAALDAVEAALGAVGPPERAEAPWEGDDGARWRMTATPGPGGGAVLCFEDVTAGAAVDRQRREFVANVSHELRTPLTALTGFVETLRGPARDDPAARDRFLAVMAEEAARMNRLIADLLALSRVEAGAHERPAARIPLGPAVARALETLAGAAEAAGMAIRADLPPDGGAAVRADADQVVQVVTNLVENALKYGRSEGGTVAVTLDGPVDAPALRGTAMRLRVEDDGPGLDPVHLPRLAERFYRADGDGAASRSRGEGSGGTGLGLAIVKHIVHRHRGRLTFDGAPGKGLTATVLLPTD